MRPVALLTVENVTRRFGGIVALDDVSFDVGAGEIVGLIGPNGAGKTTAFNVITRVYTPDGGRVAFDGNDLLRTPPHRIVRLGVARTFQNLALFPTMTMLENVLVGAHARGDRERAPARSLRLPRARARRAHARRGAPVRDAEARRDRARARLAAAAAAARRAGRRAQPRGGRAPGRPRPPHARRLRADAPARRAPHAVRDGRLRPRARPQLRSPDRLRHARRGAARPGRDRGLPRERRGCPLLELRDVEARYGAGPALHGVSLTVGEGEVVAVLGANGAGKTTTLRAISGTVRRAGEIRFDGSRLGRAPGGGRARRDRARARGPRHVRRS